MAKVEEFLEGAALSERIRQVCGADDVDCAVAFWGIAIKEHLFPAESGGKKRIVCDISMQATSRQALRDLGAPGNINLKVHDGLHAKVYISDRGAVIGSANASGRGIGLVEGARGQLLEAGMFCPPGSRSWKMAASWFKTIFKEATVIGAGELQRAPERSAELHPVASSADLAHMPLLQRLREYPAAFGGAHVAVADGRLDEAMARATKVDRTRARGVSVQSLDDVILQNGEGGELRPFVGPLLLLWRGRSVTWVRAYVDCSTWPIKQPDSVFGIEDWSGFWEMTDQKPSEVRLSRDESNLVAHLLKQDGDRWIYKAMEFAEKLEALLAGSATSGSPQAGTEDVPSAAMAYAMLGQELAKAGLSAPSTFTVRQNARVGAETLEWWHVQTPSGVSSRTPRTQAYLRAYVRIAACKALPAGGLTLEDGKLWMDRSVISRLERDGSLQFKGQGPQSRFVLTDQGRRLLSS